MGGTISNEGTEALSNVVITITATGTDFGLEPTEGYACTRRSASFVCRIERLDRGQSQFVGVLGTARRVGRDRRSRNVPLSARLTVTADGPLLGTRRETGYVFFTPSGCVTTDGEAATSRARTSRIGSVAVVERTRSTLRAGRTMCSPAPVLT